MASVSISSVFNRLKQDNERAFIPFITAGYPDIDMTAPLCVKMAEEGADIIEVGIPFSDPLADGPTIQAASQHALKNGITTDDVFNSVSQITRQSDCPIVIMCYYNTVFKYGHSYFASALKDAGANGVIIPDLPIEEAEEWCVEAKRHGIDTIFLCAPNTSPERVKDIASRSTGFLYYVSVTGITGARDELPSDVVDNIKRVKANVNIPVAVGFGISRPEQARGLSRYADGIIVGSAIIKMIAKHIEDKDIIQRDAILSEVGEFVKGMKDAVRG